jgi:hypothetical protein
MQSGVVATRGLSTLLFSFGLVVLAIPASASVDNESSPWVEWGGDLVTRPLRLSTRPLVVEVAVESSSVPNDGFPARLVIEQVSPWRRTVLDAPTTVYEENGRRIHRIEWSMTSAGSRSRPGVYTFTLLEGSLRNFAPSTSSLRVDVWPSAVKRIPESSSKSESKPDVDVVIIGRQQVTLNTREGDWYEPYH